MKKLFDFTPFIVVRLLYCSVLTISFSCYVQAQVMTTRVYTTKDGLPSTYVFGAYQDKLGYLWVGSAAGLSRFNGKDFTNYGLSDGLPDVRVLSGFMDSRLRYWAATAKGVVEFKGNRFINYPLSDSNSIKWVYQVFETKEGRIWAATNVGVYQFDINKWRKVKLYPGYDDRVCAGVIETNEGLYINYGNRIVLKKPDNTFRVIGQSKEPGFYYYNLFTSKEAIFIATLDGIYKISNQQLVRLPGVLGKLKGIYICFRDSKERFWIGKYKWGIRLLKAHDTADLLPVYNSPADLLPQGISEDNEGNLWIGSASGLTKISGRGFKIYPSAEITDKGIIRNVLQPPTGALLFNNGSMTLHVFEKDVFTKKNLSNKGNAPLSNHELIIDNYAFDDKGRSWYQLRGLALAMHEGNHIYEQNSKLAHLGKEVFDVIFDFYRKRILVAVGSQKLPCQFNDASYSLLTISNNIEVKGDIRHLNQCKNGTVLFTTDQGIIYSIDKQSICKQQLNEFGTGGVISRLYNDPSGDIWVIYSGRGLRHYTWQKDSLIFKEQLTQADGLSNNNVSDICFDNRNNLWACANSNVSVFAKKTNAAAHQQYQMVNFFDAEELQMEDSYGRMTKDQKGNIWLFSDRYLCCFYPDEINHTSITPSVEIEKLELNLKHTNWKDFVDSVSGIFQLPYDLQLSHDKNTLAIYFKGISSSGINGIKYSYLLEGLENTWSAPTANDVVSFIKLPPGKYVFKVRAQLPNTNWSEPAGFSFKIKKAFWQTWLFYILVVVIILAGMYLLFRYQLKQKIKLLEMRNRFSQDLHDEIGASVSGINLLSQMAAEKLDNNKPDEASEYLNKVKNYSQDVIEKLGDMVWVFNPQNDSIDKLLQRLKAFSISVAQSKNIQLHFATGKESEIVNLSIQQRKAIYLISKEAINNAFKYAACSNIFYSLYTDGFKWRLRIQDDGKGFIPAEDKAGNGLKNMQSRADEIGADFNIQSQPGGGTIVNLVF